MPAALIDSSVTVWHVSLAEPPAVVARAAALLSADELARAARFHFDRDRKRFVLARAALRLILASRLNTKAETLRFVYSPAGKPSLAPETAAAGGELLAFNLSHSHELALVALAHGGEVGVDVEHHRPLPDLAAIARRFFSPREAECLLALPVDQQPAAFFRCWTRKEAYLKARGDGIAGGLDRFDVSFAPGEPPAVLRTLDDPAEAARWCLLDLIPGDNYAAAVAVTVPAPRLVVELWHFPVRNF